MASRQLDLPDPVTRFCAEALPTNSIFTFLHRQRDVLFPDELFVDLFSGRGRRSVPPSVVATVMVLQRLEGLTARRWSATPLMPVGGTRPGWAATTRGAGAGSLTPCWWTCAPGWPP